MEGYKKKIDFRENDIVFSQAIKAGKRIYYLDVKKNKKNELFLVITESKKLITENNHEKFSVQYEKHKVFLYKEDFDKFLNGLTEAIDYIRENNTVDFVPHKINAEESVDVMDDEINLTLDF